MTHTMFDYRKRLKNLRDELKKRRIDSFLVTNVTNVTYLTGFTGSDSVLLFTPDSQFFLTDSRYVEEAKDTVKAFTVVEVTSSTYETISNIIRKHRIKKLGFESMNLPYEVAKRLEGYVDSVSPAPVKNLVEVLRTVKDKNEIDAITESIRTTKDVLKKIAAAIRPGISEASLSGRIECEFIKKGAKAGFQTIVACGRNSSKPHAHPTDAKIAKNDIVMIDIGCTLNSYNSDMTRMVLLGKVRNKIKEIYGIVKTAQEKALEKIKAGIKISDIDYAGRNYICEKGYGKFFGHSLGHGIGMDVHEEPSLSARNSGTLRPGMVFTVEPAIYIPGLGGVRIEDMVVATDKGCKILTR